MKVQDKIEMLECAALVPYARNSRTHSKEQIAQIARSIQEFGFTNPVLIDGQGGIVAGHGRVMAAQSIGVESVPCLRVDWLTEAQKRAYIIADNQLALQAGWDDEILADELKSLKAEGGDLSILGIGDAELDRLLLEDEPSAPQNYSGQSVQEKLLVMVECKSDAEQRAVLDQLTKGGHVCRALTS